MTAILVGVLALAVLVALSTPGAPRRRVRAALAGVRSVPAAGPPSAPGGPPRGIRRWRRRNAPPVPMTLVVQQMSALLKGGRTPARLWDELWLLHVGGASAASTGGGASGRTSELGPGSVRMLAAARAAATRGSPVGAAIRSAAAAGYRGTGAAKTLGRRADAGVRENRVWFQLAACFDVAEAAGSPLAEVLTRFAAQLEAEDDAVAARQTALAGPRATVQLLTWLPFLGMGLGVLLGVDPVEVLGTPWGAAALAAGLTLTMAGRIWSARLVRAAEGVRP